jgi:hypothetical protein
MEAIRNRRRKGGKRENDKLEVRIRAKIRMGYRLKRKEGNLWKRGYELTHSIRKEKEEVILPNP